MLSRDVIEDHVQSDEGGQMREILQRDYAAIIECQHLQEPVSLEFCPNFSGEVASEPD